MTEQDSATLYARLAKGMNIMEHLEAKGETGTGQYRRCLDTFTKLDKAYGEACDREGQATQMEVPV